MTGWMTGWMDGKLHFSPTSFTIYNVLPILGGQKAADSIEGWCAAGNLGASRVSIRMDDRTDGQRDDRTDGQRDDRTDGWKVSFHTDVLYYM
jgi:hypothetical protein